MSPIRQFVASALVLALVVTSAAAIPACGGSSPTITPAAAAAAEKDLVLLVRDASAAMLAGYKAGTVPAAVADPYFDAVDTTVLPLARRVKAALQAWQLADAPGRVGGAAEVALLLTELETQARAVFGRSLPPGVAASIGDIAQRVYDTIAAIRGQIARR